MPYPTNLRFTYRTATGHVIIKHPDISQFPDYDGQCFMHDCNMFKEKGFTLLSAICSFSEIQDNPKYNWWFTAPDEIDDNGEDEYILVPRTITYSSETGLCV